MNTIEFMNLSTLDKVELVNQMLKKEEKDHLKNVASKLGLSESTFSKTMRDNATYQYNKSTKQYDRIIPIEEYKNYLQSSTNEEKTEETLLFVGEHLEELKKILHEYKSHLTLEPEIYDPNSKTIIKSIQINDEIYQRFSVLHSSKYSHLRLRDIFSKCLLDFINTYHPEPLSESSQENQNNKENQDMRKH